MPSDGGLDPELQTIDEFITSDTFEHDEFLERIQIGVPITRERFFMGCI